MPVFRELTPNRRPDRKECKHYRSYRKTLREDFNNRCGYCDDSDRLRIRSFTIDHFVPQNPKDFRQMITTIWYIHATTATLQKKTNGRLKMRKNITMEEKDLLTPQKKVIQNYSRGLMLVKLSQIMMTWQIIF